MNKRWFWAAVLGLFLAAGCAPDPRNEADAYRIRREADQFAAAAEQNRQHEAEIFRLEQVEREQTSAEWVARRVIFIRWTMIFATGAACLALVGAGIGGGVSLVGLGLGVARGAALKANLIYLDRNTGQFPMVSYEGHGIVTLTDPNTGSTLRLDTRNEANRQMIASAGAVRLSGVVSNNARLHKKDPAGVAMVGTNPVTIFDPMMMDATEDDYDN